jgi:hypothetical protein
VACLYIKGQGDMTKLIKGLVAEIFSELGKQCPDIIAVGHDDMGNPVLIDLQGEYKRLLELDKSKFSGLFPITA